MWNKMHKIGLSVEVIHLKIMTIIRTGRFSAQQGAFLFKKGGLDGGA
jgi:hypothetical protein